MSLATVCQLATCLWNASTVEQRNSLLKLWVCVAIAVRLFCHHCLRPKNLCCHFWQENQKFDRFCEIWCDITHGFRWRHSVPSRALGNRASVIYRTLRLMLYSLVGVKCRQTISGFFNEIKQTWCTVQWASELVFTTKSETKISDNTHSLKELSADTVSISAYHLLETHRNGPPP